MKNTNQRKAGALLSYVNLGISCIIPMIYTPVMLEILGQEEYGVYSLANSVISYLGLLNFGMGSAVVRYAAKYRTEGKPEEVQKLMGIFFRIYCFLAIIVCVVGFCLVIKADVFFSKGLTTNEIKRLRILMVILIFSTAISLPASIYSSIVSAYERFIFAKTLGIGGTILSPVLNLIVLHFGYTSIGIAVISFCIQVINICIYGIYCYKKIGLYPKFEKIPRWFLKEIWTFSSFVFFSAVVDLLYWATDKVLLGALLGSAAVAIYNVGGTFTAMLQNMSQSISNMFTPKVMAMAAKNSPISEVSALLIRIGRLQFYIVSFILSGYIVFGQRFLLFWAGENYGEAYYVALLTMIPLSVPLIQSIAYSTIVARNKHRFRAIIYAVIAVVNIVTTYFMIPKFGVIGAAICTAVAYAVGNGLIMNLYYCRIIKLDIIGFWKNIGKISIVPVVMILGGYSIVNIVLKLDKLLFFIASIVIYSILFWIFIWLFSMNQYEKDLFKGIIRKFIT